MYTILFVCTGNTCRSVMAQAIAHDLIEKKGLLKKVKARSAGTSVLPNTNASEYAIKIILDKNLKLKRQTAKQLTSELVEESDLILTMTRRHKQYVLSLVPAAENKVYTLKEYARSLEAKDDQRDEELLELAGVLEAKEQAFSEENKQELEDLKKEYQELKEKLQNVEKKIQDWHIRFHAATKAEREALKKLEEQFLDIDVSDPIGQPIEVYKECADEIEEMITSIFQKVDEEDK